MIDLPEFVSSLEEAGDHRDCYVPYAGSYRLSEKAKTYIAQANAEIAELEAKHAAEMEARKARGRRLDDRLNAAVRKDALERALRAGGARPELLHGAVAFIEKTWQLEVDDNTVTVGGDRRPLSEAIEQWLSTDAGAAFSARRPATPDSVFTKQIQRFTRTG